MPKLTRYTPTHAHQVADIRGRLGDKDVQVLCTDSSVTIKVIGVDMASHLHLSRRDASELAEQILLACKDAERVAMMGT
jgi:hypothetical protein